MGQALARLRAAVKVVADAGSNSLKIALGSTGSFVDWPDDPTKPWLGKQSVATGQGWTVPSIPDTTLAGIATEIDRDSPARAQVSTNGAGVAPTITEQIGISAVTKNEGLDTLLVTLSPAYSSAYYHVDAKIVGSASICVVSARAVGNFTLRFEDHAGATFDINSRTVTLHCQGKHT